MGPSMAMGRALIFMPPRMPKPAALLVVLTLRSCPTLSAVARSLRRISVEPEPAHGRFRARPCRVALLLLLWISLTCMLRMRSLSRKVSVLMCQELPQGSP